MIKYKEIIKEYGTPLNHLNRPYQPFKLKTVHYVVGGVIVGLAVYGAYRIIKDIKDQSNGAPAFNFKSKQSKPEA